MLAISFVKSDNIPPDSLRIVSIRCYHVDIGTLAASLCSQSRRIKDDCTVAASSPVTLLIQEISRAGERRKRDCRVVDIEIEVTSNGLAISLKIGVCDETSTKRTVECSWSLEGMSTCIQDFTEHARLTPVMKLHP